MALIKSHSFIVKRANGTDDFRVQLRASYWNTITSQRKLEAAIDKSIIHYESKHPAYGAALRAKFTAHNLLDIMRLWGMIAGSERLTKREEQKKMRAPKCPECEVRMTWDEETGQYVCDDCDLYFGNEEEVQEYAALKAAGSL